ncbi:hypothetical protein CROQUDRAFT_654190 [Cronartium quercuum f. sp. fusiforme G11]|uniref:Uncharacterized protein n=1 Tax=Cronartium quercuum f. sp. fusiforme G11 TaxID=708437 RepID=A0A9P6TEQ4_9BASI|nr:hypothetical protein CROQUDRAFT_654190 [Cronartium quercuum f. sp. fusiforme G11]
MEKLWDLSYVGKGLFAIVGIWSSFLFLKVSQQKYSEQHLPKKLIITARKEVFASIDTLPNQFQSYRFPEKPPQAH